MNAAAKCLLILLGERNAGDMAKASFDAETKDADPVARAT
jgi:hypothetical protein